MAIVATTYSTELAQVPPQSPVYSPLRPTQYTGRMRIAGFTRALLAEPKDTTIIGLCRLPKNSRIMVIKFITDATTSTSTFDVGLIGANLNGFIDDTVGATVADNGTWFGAVPAVAGAQTALVANTAAQHNGYILKKDCYIICTIRTTNISAAANITGYAEYVLD